MKQFKTGEVHIYAPMNEVRLMKKLACIKNDNMTAMSSTMLTNNAQGIIMYLNLCIN